MVDLVASVWTVESDCMWLRVKLFYLASHFQIVSDLQKQWKSSQSSYNYSLTPRSPEADVAEA